jgi:hypothetical protein
MYLNITDISPLKVIIESPKPNYDLLVRSIVLCVVDNQRSCSVMVGEVRIKFGLKPRLLIFVTISDFVINRRGERTITNDP